MGQIVDVTSTPWIDSGDAPPLALDRDKRDIISQGIADPLVDYDIVPLTYTNSRWSAFFYRAAEADLKHVLPKCLDLEEVLSAAVSGHRRRQTSRAAALARRVHAHRRHLTMCNGGQLQL
jgi:hypothetical protein